MHSSVPLNPKSILFTQHNQQMKIILFTEDLVPTKYPHPSLLMNYGCLEPLPETWLGCVKSFSGVCVLFWMKQAGKRPVGLKWILYLKQLTKYSSSYHVVSVAYFFPDPFSRLWLVLSRHSASLRAHQRVPRASRHRRASGHENKETLIGAPAAKSLGPLSQPSHEEETSIFLLTQLKGNNSSRYNLEILWSFNSLKL